MFSAIVPSMKNVIIVHGRPGKEEYYSDKYPSSSNFHWIPWLQKQLLIKDIKADTPEIPHAYAPEWKIWKTEFERFDISPGTILVGHSNGAGFLVRWLSENVEVSTSKLILMAPSFNEGELTDGSFFDFEIDSGLSKRVGQIIIFLGLKDSQSVHDTVKKIMDEISGVKLIDFPNNEHFTTEDMGSEAFPELLEEVLK